MTPGKKKILWPAQLWQKSHLQQKKEGLFGLDRGRQLSGVVNISLEYRSPIFLKAEKGELNQELRLSSNFSTLRGAPRWIKGVGGCCSMTLGSTESSTNLCKRKKNFVVGERGSARAPSKIGGRYRKSRRNSCFIEGRTGRGRSKKSRIY